MFRIYSAVPLLILFLSFLASAKTPPHPSSPAKAVRPPTKALNPLSPLSLHPNSAATKLSPQQVVQRYADKIFRDAAAVGVAMVVINGDKEYFASAGSVRPGSKIRPWKNSLVRIASISKLMTSEVMLKLADRGEIKLDDPLIKFAPPGMRVPTYAGQPIRLINLSTHTSGLPREQPGGKPLRPVFVWPTKSQRWAWLQKSVLKSEPGALASYSNLAYDLLADALSIATGVPYQLLFHTLVAAPARMKNTTFQPTQDQCRVLMIPKKGASPCISTLAAIGSGGIYSTPGDMGRWMKQFLNTSGTAKTEQARRLHKLIYQRDKLTSVIGLDVAGKVDALGMGWVYMAPRKGLPGIIQKTGGGGGFITYMAMVPQNNLGVFVVATRTEQTRFRAMSSGANNLLAEFLK